MSERTTVYIALGANLNQPQERVREGAAALAELPESELLALSSLYRTPPMGPPGQPDYVNAVAVLRTGLAPHDLLVHMMRIEASQGRVRDQVRWGPRTLDLDLLLYGDRCLDSDDLTLPHPRMHQRAFVLIPLAEVAEPALSIPGQGDVQELAAACDASGIERIEAR